MDGNNRLERFRALGIMRRIYDQGLSFQRSLKMR